MNPELTLLLRIAAEAARVVMEVYAQPFSVDYKGPQDPVTAADRRANALICERLEQEFPGVPIVAEESDPSTFDDFRKSDRVFFVDPVDGTREFVDRNGEFAVMIGLLEGSRPSDLLGSGDPPPRVAFGTALAIEAVACGVGLVDSMMAGERWKKHHKVMVAPQLGAGRFGLALGGSL